MQKHNLVHGHHPFSLCADCGILGAASFIKVHQKFKCNDHKAQALHHKKPFHKAFDKFSQGLKAKKVPKEVLKEALKERKDNSYR